MTTFRALHEISNAFEENLRIVSNDLFSAKLGDTFEDKIEKKLRDLNLFTSKLRFLQAKPLSLTPEIADADKDEALTLTQYTDTATNKVIEQMFAKCVLQTQAVKKLFTTSERNLSPEQIERKQKITQQLQAFSVQETEYHQLQTILEKKQGDLDSLRQKWDQELGELRDLRNTDGVDQVDNSGPLHMKLGKLVDKMEVMRWLIGRLVTVRGTQYDWLADPLQRLAALKNARAANTIDSFLQ